MYFQPFHLAKQIAETSGKTHLEGVYPKGKKWYARARASRGNVIEFSFDSEAEAYACWVGITRCRDELESAPKLSTAARVALISKMGLP